MVLGKPESVLAYQRNVLYLLQNPLHLLYRIRYLWTLYVAIRHTVAQKYALAHVREKDPQAYDVIISKTRAFSPNINIIRARSPGCTSTLMNASSSLTRHALLPARISSNSSVSSCSARILQRHVSRACKVGLARSRDGILYY